MGDALSIALSGIAAQGQRIAAAASNISNATTVGALPTAESPASTVYKPLSVSYTALSTASGGGVFATVSEDPNGYTPVYDPSSVYANNEGLIAAPTVDLAQELTTVMTSKTVYKADLSVIRTQNEMLGELLDTLS